MGLCTPCAGTRPGAADYLNTSEIPEEGGLRLRHRGRIQRRSWILKPREASKTPPNRLLFRICFSMPFWIDFWSIFDPNLVPTWLPESIKIHEKTMPRCLPKMTSFLNRFLIDFRPQLGLQNQPKSKKNRCQEAFPSWLPFLIDFWSIFTPNFDPWNLQNHCFSYGKTKFFQKIAFRI